MLKLYNTLTRKKEEFKPIKKGQVGMYSCGLTVYNYGHIGNYRAFVASDILRRYLEFLSYKVKKIVNITDVDDKTIKGSIKEGKSLKEYTSVYEKAFFEDEKAMNIKKADKYPKATEHIKEMIELISKLLEKKYAYKTEDGIYFNVKKFKDYGKLAKIKLKNLKEGARINNDEYDKENAKDFALWKFYTNEDGNVFWETKLGKGRPGWHIECSVMSTKHLGQPFDIHTGGIDLVFPHHENEIAQSEAATGKKFVNYWVHNEWIMVDGKKMSKSLGNYYTLRDIIKTGYNPLALRYFYLTGHYKTQLDFTLDNLKNAQNSYERLKRIIGSLSEDNKTLKKEDDKKVNKEYLEEFEKAMNDDLNTPEALQVLWKLLRDEKADGKIQTIKKMDEVFGLDLLKKEKIVIPNNIKKLVDEREKARKNKDWKKADEIRNKIKGSGYKIDDTNDGVKISKI
ncbi:MAG: cysteine--tRNA ligase [Candidatus Nanoarchaeia archaeon]|nr:cysteine--tRNA ligase [Candidatus Nanoarchaeia archaeon]MDD5740953.1 cysteine--tRNA ligase [Candidatus Nanoarchaeia archaeon]